MKLNTLMVWTALLGTALAAQAAEVAPAKGATPGKAASAPAVVRGAKPAGAAPTAGGSGGGAATIGSNTGTQVSPKKPKCPDPLNTACPAAQVPVNK